MVRYLRRGYLMILKMTQEMIKKLQKVRIMGAQVQRLYSGHIRSCSVSLSTKNDIRGTVCNKYHLHNQQSVIHPEADKLTH